MLGGVGLGSGSMGKLGRALVVHGVGAWYVHGVSAWYVHGFVFHTVSE